MDIKLMPVVELEPAAFATKEHLTPNCVQAEDEAGWEAYWRDSLADVDVEIEHLPGTWFVPLRAVLANRSARVIISRIADLENAAELDELGVLDGGLVLMGDGEPLLLPQCCGDLGAAQNLRAFLTEPSDTWTGVWIGHPMLSLRRSGAFIEFSRLVDPGGIPAMDVHFRVGADELAAALAVAEVELAAAAVTVEELLRGLTSLDVKDAARILTGGGR